MEHDPGPPHAPPFPGKGSLEGRVIAQLRTIYDPEIPLNIYDLGLIYWLEVDETAGRVSVRMTLTSPTCPIAQSFPEIVRTAVLAVEGVSEVEVELVWDPPWTMEMMGEAARLQLGLL
ncbi:MAG: iron sulfur cluster assembly protein SufT [Pseudomonadota bacterium]|jgi:FeS assembly SUF system protein